MATTLKFPPRPDALPNFDRNADEPIDDGRDDPATASWMPRRQLWLNYAITYLTTLGVMVTGMLTYRMASLNFGEEGFSQYALVRRVISFLQPLLALGIAVSLSRKVAACKYDSQSINESDFLMAGAILTLASTFTFSVALFLCPGYFAYAVFGAENFREQALAMSPMLIGLGLHIVCYAQLHGRFSMRMANLVQFLNIGLIPLLMLLWPQSIPATLFWTGLAISLVSLIGIGAQFHVAKERIRGVVPALTELVRFGPPRVPGDVAFAALMMLPAIMVTHTCDVKLGGLVAFGITLLTIAQATTTPISTILLPQATQMLRSGRITELRSNIAVLLTLSLGVSALGILTVFVASDFVLRFCLGQYAAELPLLAKIIMVGALPLNCHTCFRSIVDAGKERAVNARSSILALGCYFLAWFIAKQAIADLYAAPIALVIALFCLAGLSSWEVWQILKPTSEWATLKSQLALREAA